MAFLGLDSVFPVFSAGGRGRSIGYIGYIVTFLCGVVCLPTCLTGWINSFSLFFSSVTVFVVVIVILLVFLVVWDRVIGANVFVFEITLSIFRLFFLPFRQTALTSVMS